ncbi:MAG: hypothetical protein EXS35_13395 [Pedosphaera sp.]|nr:hypothetical protein [Pedosphaera sp.]
MKTIQLASLIAALFFAGVLSTRAEETVTILKARLLELERKEKELDSLKGELGRARGEQERLQRANEKAEAERVKAEAARAKLENEQRQLTKAKEAAEARAAAVTVAAAQAEPVIAHDSPALASLPPLKKGDVVDALDLMNHYRADAAGAARRYEAQRIRVRGVVTAIAKPMFVSHCEIVLQTTERQWKILCRVDPPREFTGIYTAQHGEALGGITASGARLTLARTGQTVEIEGWCKGLEGQTLTVSAGKLVATE